MAFKDYYKILGIDKTASAREVEEAYLKLSARYSSEQYENDELNQRILNEINEAFKVLGNPSLREEYDRKGADWIPPDFLYDTDLEEDVVTEIEGEDIVESITSFFEKGLKEVIRLSRQQQDQQNIHLSINVPFTLSEALRGAIKTVELEDGTSVQVPIPKGAFSGQHLRLRGKGLQSADGKTQGDLWVTLVEMPHAYFFRKGNDILYHASVDVYTAMLGGTISVPTLEGKVDLPIPTGFVSKGLLKIQDAGIPVFNQGNSRGDFYVELHIELPKSLSEEERALIQKLKDMRSEK
ncbi:MAG TPA: J domain-containing protein [Phaeodactylibacter sp.]|nr:J domain-containing protein [Phaeodactylibacter sp.]